ncbi:hypothetical protein C8Q80DRAFT_1156897 [Daedaleopsis nitida]|nr:hypothetical protein C8Q80DRAFT_1156897 [Daedaleopsis nitida]
MSRLAAAMALPLTIVFASSSPSFDREGLAQSLFAAQGPGPSLSPPTRTITPLPNEQLRLRKSGSGPVHRPHSLSSGCPWLFQSLLSQLAVLLAIERAANAVSSATPVA